MSDQQISSFLGGEPTMQIALSLVAALERGAHNPLPVIMATLEDCELFGRAAFEFEHDDYEADDMLNRNPHAGAGARVYETPGIFPTPIRGPHVCSRHACTTPGPARSSGVRHRGFSTVMERCRLGWRHLPPAQ